MTVITMTFLHNADLVTLLLLLAVNYWSRHSRCLRTNRVFVSVCCWKANVIATIHNNNNNNNNNSNAVLFCKRLTTITTTITTITTLTTLTTISNDNNPVFCKQRYGQCLSLSLCLKRIDNNDNDYNTNDNSNN